MNIVVFCLCAEINKIKKFLTDCSVQFEPEFKPIINQTEVILGSIHHVWQAFLLRDSALLSLIHKRQATDTLSRMLQNICELTYHFYHGIRKLRYSVFTCLSHPLVQTNLVGNNGENQASKQQQSNRHASSKWTCHLVMTAQS